MSMPCGSSDGLPIGMMLVAKHFDESSIYRAAYALSKLPAQYADREKYLTVLRIICRGVQTRFSAYASVCLVRSVRYCYHHVV